MDKYAIWKWLILILGVSFSAWVVVPPKEKVRLGLDLMGGTSFVVKIDEQEAENEIRSRGANLSDKQVADELKRVLDGAQERAVEVIRNRVDSLGIAEPVIYPARDNRIIVQLPGVDEKKREDAEQSIKSLAFLEFRLVHERNAELVAELFEKNLVPPGYLISRQGDGSYFRRDPAIRDEAMDRAFRDKVSRFQTPDAGYELMMERVEVQAQNLYRPVFVKRRREMSGEFLSSAMVEPGPLNQPQVSLRFDGRGAKQFASITSDYAPGGPRNPNPQKFRQLAIVLDGTLYSAPTIREAIYGGRAQISGSFTQREAALLSRILNAGSLPAPVMVVEKRFVAPSLGSDSIRSGVRASLLGCAGVLIFMAIYYRMAGLVANMALILNAVLLPLGMILTAGFLGIFSSDPTAGGAVKLPVLTLPGIAGIALAIGMAVDANVLIFERMREEFRTGKRLWPAIAAGYDRAFSAIFDSNITTLLSGVVMFAFGSGPIRGYAVTLCAGLIVSMFTALVVTKLIFALMVRFNWIKTLSMMSLIKPTNIDWISKRKIAAAVSLAVILGSWGFLLFKSQTAPTQVFGVDFTGGTSITLKVEKKVPVETLRQTLATAGLKDCNIQYQQEMEVGGDTYLQVQTVHEKVEGKKTTDVVVGALKTTHADAQFSLAQDDVVGGIIGKELKKNAVVAVALSLVIIIIYLAIRFEFGFALGAIVAVFHDALIVVGVYVLLGRQLNMTIVAAVLTIIGYSVNDTIVIFDRIREDLKVVRTKTFAEICNQAVNETLARTILTSGITFITVLMLLLFGGGAILDLALALTIGMIAGTYSTVYIATPVVLAWHRGRKPSFAIQPT